MSLTLALVNTATAVHAALPRTGAATHALAMVQATVPHAGDVRAASYVDKANTLSVDISGAAKTAGGAAVLAYSVFNAVRSRFTVGALVGIALGAGLFLFIINNTSLLEKNTKDTVGASPAVHRGGPLQSSAPSRPAVLSPTRF